MSKELYEEALADVKRLKKVAEDNAKRDLAEAVAPRIRDLIEKELLREINEEDNLDEDVPGAPGSPSISGDLMTDDEVPVSGVPEAGDTDLAAISMPDEEGKVTLDLDSLMTDPAGAAVESPMFGGETEYEMSMESVEALSPIINATKSNLVKELESSLYRLGESIKRFKAASMLVRESRGYSEHIAQMISRVENMYDYVQESVTDPRSKSSYEAKLESYFKELNKLQEHKMSKRTLRDMMNESDVTLKLTGLPDEIDLDSVGVDLITGEEGEEGSEEMDLGDSGEGGEEGGEEAGEDLDLDSLDLGGDEDSEDEGEDTKMGESRRLSDNTIVEIDEGMLRREIARMKNLREDAVPSTKGSGPGKGTHSFGGGKEEADLPWGVDVTTESDADEDDEDDMMDEGPDGDLTMDEDQDQDQDDELDEMDGLEQSYGMDQAEDTRDVGGDVAPKSMGGGAETRKQSREPGQTMESLKRRITFEKRLQERAKVRSASLKKEAARAIASKDSRKLNALKTENATLRQRFTESVNRVRKMSKVLAEAKSRRGVRPNGTPTRPAENMAEGTLRNKLAETNLFNAKLVYTNKLLQNEALSKKQKAEIIQRLDEANSLREVKLIYESLTKTLAGTSRPLAENADRKVMGSSSRAMRPASTSLNEGYETDRWQKLAGINK